MKLRVKWIIYYLMFPIMIGILSINKQLNVYLAIAINILYLMAFVKEFTGAKTDIVILFFVLISGNMLLYTLMIKS